jgi:hypothetical protein
MIVSGYYGLESPSFFPGTEARGRNDVTGRLSEVVALSAGLRLLYRFERMERQGTASLYHPRMPVLDEDRE